MMRTRRIVTTGVSPSRRRRASLALEPLESRHLPATFVVVNTNDDSDTGSLRWAIDQANALPGADRIEFAIPTTDPGYDAKSGVWTIAISQALPPLMGSDPVTIDGCSQPGASPNDLPVTSADADGNAGTDATLTIELSGGNAGVGTDGLSIQASSCVIEGLVINGFDGSGIAVLSGGDNTTIRGNFIGTDPSGTQAVPNNSRGVSIDGSSGNTVGGAAPADANLISGNVGTGVRIDGSTAAASQKQDPGERHRPSLRRIP